MYLPDFHPRETRTLWLRLFHKLRDNRALFTEDDYNRFIKILETSKGEIRIFSDIRRKELKEINEGVEIKTKKVENLIVKIREELAKLNEEERSACQEPFQEMEDELKKCITSFNKNQSNREF
jgi:dsDNA-specific endonuclease/ATPase MutS2